MAVPEAGLVRAFCVDTFLDLYSIFVFAEPTASISTSVHHSEEVFLGRPFSKDPPLLDSVFDRMRTTVAMLE